MISKHTVQKNIYEFILIFASISLYLLNNLIFKKISTGICYYFFICYFNDLICPSFFVSYTNVMLSFVNKKIEKIHHIIVFCFLCGLVWEFIAPFLKKGSVTDFYDLLCYCIGGVLYWTIKKLMFKICKK